MHKPCKLMKIRAEFLKRNTTLRKWSITEGYEPGSTYMAIRRWSEGKKVRGIKSSQIICTMLNYFGIEADPFNLPSAVNLNLFKKEV